MVRSFLQYFMPAIVSSLLPAYTPNTASPDEPRPAVKADKIKVRGKIVEVKGPDRFIVRTDDNRDVVLYTNTSTRYRMNGRAARFSDLRVGVFVNTEYVTERDRYIVVDSVAIGEATEPAPREEGTLVEGTIVRVVGKDQVIVRSRQGKEVIVYISPETRYLIEDRSAVFTDFRPEAQVRIMYDVRDKKNYARTFHGHKGR